MITQEYITFESVLPNNIIPIFRLGDFWEIFGDKAEMMAKKIGTTYTKRNNVRMTGFPVHSEGEYLRDILDSGFGYAKVEIVDGRRVITSIEK